MKRRPITRRRPPTCEPRVRELARAPLGGSFGPYSEGSQVLAPPLPEEQLRGREDAEEFAGRESDRELDVVEQMRRSR